MSHNDDEIQYTYEDYEAMAECLLSRQPHRPTIGIISGSGMMGLTGKLEERYTVPFEKVPKFPLTTVEGHVGQFCFGTLKGKKVVMVQGRFHLYEGYPPWKVIAPIRVMKLLGVETVIVTNAAGGLNPSYSIGDIVVLYDHIGIVSMAGINPLFGKNDDRFGPRFVDQARVYDEPLRETALKAAESLSISTFIKQGVYLMVGGPTYETPAEARYLRFLGGDVVGMSTVPEVMAARHCGMRVLGLSLVTNMVVMDYNDEGAAGHNEVQETAKWRTGILQDLIAGVLQRLEAE